MGYVLPVQFDQYTQYHNRVGSKGKPTPKKIQIEKVKHAYLAPLQFSVKKETAPSITYYKKQVQQQISNADKIYAELTGVGRLFNVVI